MSTFFREDPELFAPQVIFNGTFAHRFADASEHFVPLCPTLDAERLPGFHVSVSQKVTPTLISRISNSTFLLFCFQLIMVASSVSSDLMKALANKAQRLPPSGVLPGRNFDKLSFVLYAHVHSARLPFGIWVLNNLTLPMRVSP